MNAPRLHSQSRPAPFRNTLFSLLILWLLSTIGIWLPSEWPLADVALCTAFALGLLLILGLLVLRLQPLRAPRMPSLRHVPESLERYSTTG